jgi:hypothetical protein
MPNLLRATLCFAFGFMSAFYAMNVEANAQTRWQVTKMESASEAAAALVDTRELANAGFPDGRIATYEDGDISSAWYGLPTERYAHGILGDAIEAARLYVKTKNGKTLKLDLTKLEVFEDQTPRLADLDGDGTVEIITIRSSLLAGASMTIYGLEGIRLKQKATTAFIGRPNRWLNIAGIAPFLGTKYKEIAYVVTPHIGGTLFFYRYDGKKLIKLSAATDVSNHAIGSREMRLSSVADVDSDGSSDIAVPSNDRDLLKIFGFKNKKLKQIATAALPSPIVKAIGLQTEGTKGFLVGLENDDYYLVHP